MSMGAGSRVMRHRAAPEYGRGNLMDLSARNQLKGTVRDVKLGTIMGEVVVDVGGQEVVAAITRASIERLGLKAGDGVLVVMKATEVMIAKP